MLVLLCSASIPVKLYMMQFSDRFSSGSCISGEGYLFSLFLPALFSGIWIEHLAGKTNFLFSENFV